MEDMLWKFPHVGNRIFKKLSNKNLARCKKVEKTWETFIINDKFYKQKVYYEMKQKEKSENGMTPLHKAAKEGNFSEFKAIIYHVEDKNPQDYKGRTPLHYAAAKGHLSISELIVNNTKDKNPKNEFGITPLHLAAG